MARRKREKGDKPHKDKRPRRRRFGCSSVFLLLLLLAAGLLYAAPLIIAREDVLPHVVRAALADFDGKVSVGSATLNWFSPVSLKEVEIADSQEQPLLQAGSLTTRKPLWKLVLARGQYGQLTIDKPHLHLRLREKGSNLEDLLARLPSTGGTAPPSVGGTVVVTGGTVDVVDTVTGRQWQAQGLEATVQMQPDKGATHLAAKIHSRLQSEVGEVAAVDADMKLRLPAGDGSVAAEQLDLRTEDFPLALIQPLLRRATAKAEVAGKLTAVASGSWEPDKGHQAIDIQRLLVKQLVCRAQPWLGQDRLQLASVEASGRIERTAGKLTAQQLVVRSPLATLEAEGALDLAAFADGLRQAALAPQPYRLRADVDLAQLAKQLPHTLHIRAGTEITSGKLQLAMDSRTEQERQRWLVNAQVDQLQATSGGRQLSWKEPIQLSLTASRNEQGPVIEQLMCTSSFLQCTGQATLTEGSLTLDGNLDRLAAELGRFVDLGQLRLAGKLAGKIHWRRTAADRVVARGEAQVERLELAGPGWRTWKEDLLKIRLDGETTVQSGRVADVHSAALRVEAGGDLLELALAEPVTQWTSGQPLPARARLTGELASWLPRLQTWIPLSGWQVAGQVVAAAEGTVSASGCQIQSGKATLRNLQARCDRVAIDEPEVRVELSGQWERTGGLLRCREGTLTSSTVALRAEDVVYDALAPGMKLRGAFSYRSDLGRLAAWFQSPQSSPSTRLSGMLVGRAGLAHRDGVTLFQCSGQIDRLAVARPTRTQQGGTTLSAHRAAWRTLWTKKQVRFKGHGDYVHADDQLRFEDMQVTSDGLQLNAAGKLEQLSGPCQIDVTGTLQYDLAQLEDQIRPYVSQDFRIAGRGSRPFALRGPLRADGGSAADQAYNLAGLTGEASLDWSSAVVYGMQIGPGELKARMADGILAFEPLELTVNRGQVRLLPRVLLAETPPVVILQPGTAVENVYLSPEVCHRWLKYVAPLLADVTRADGRLSVQLADARLPLTDPATGTVKGSLRIEQGQVGPGPLGQQLVMLADQVVALMEGKPSGGLLGASSRRWVTLPAQTVPVQLVRGRVHHDGLQLVVGQVQVRTRGSVGLDQTLSLVAEIPTSGQSGLGQLLPGLRGQTLRVPITGTLSSPRVDDRVLADLARQALGNSVENLLEKELQKGLEGLFRPYR